MNANDITVQSGHEVSVNTRQRALLSSLPARVLGNLVRILVAFVSLAMSLFCGFGFLASFEPGPDALLWKIGYGALACVFLMGAVVLVRGLRQT